MTATTIDEVTASTPGANPAPQPLALQPATSQGAVMLRMIEAALSRPDFDVAKMQALFDLKRQYDAEEARKAFVTAMAAFKCEPLTIFKRKQVGYTTKDGDFVGYTHAELSDVTEVVGPAMAKHGLSYRWDIRQVEGRVHVSCIVTHSAGHSETVTMDAPPDNSGKKNNLQQIASSTTYLQRYTLLAASGMSTTGMDNDGGDAGDDDSAPDKILAEFRDAAMQGETALREHYNAHPPGEKFWQEHGPALKKAARKVDADAGGQ